MNCDPNRQEISILRCWPIACIKQVHTRIETSVQRKKKEKLDMSLNKNMTSYKNQVKTWWNWEQKEKKAAHHAETRRIGMNATFWKSICLFNGTWVSK